MKKIASLLLIITLVLMSGFGNSNLHINLNNKVRAYEAPAPFMETINFSGGTSISLNNPKGLGTTTLFSGTGVTAYDTVENQNVNFNIYGNANPASAVTIEASRQEYYLMGDGNTYIDTGIKPNSETTVEIYYMIPKGYSYTSAYGQHPDVMGACASNAAEQHFGGPLMNTGGQIQFLYGSWPTNSDKLTANFGWDKYVQTKDTYFYSKLEASGGVANAYITNYIDDAYSGTINQDITGYNFNNLLIFGQQNNGSVVNRFTGGIKEVKITQKGEVVRHYFAVEEGSTDFTEEEAEADSMYDIITGKYYGNSGTGDFKVIADVSSTNKNEIEITTAIDGGLTGEKVIDDSHEYTYIKTVDGAEEKWAADYLEVNQYENKVVLHKYSYNKSTGEISYTTDTPIPGTLKDDLLSIRTTNGVTMLSNGAGLWMDGIVGPIVNYTIELGSSADVSISKSSSSIVAAKYNVFDLEKSSIYATDKLETGSLTGATWKVLGKTFHISTMISGYTTSLDIKELLFSTDQILQQYATKNDDDHPLEYTLVINVEFVTATIYKVNVVTDGIGMNINGSPRSSLSVTAGTQVTIEGDFNHFVYEFASVNLTEGSYSVNGNAITFTVNSNMTIEYDIKPKVYDVQVVGKTTNGDEVVLANRSVAEINKQVYYNVDDTEHLVTLNTNVLDYEKRYLIEVMDVSDFDRICIYDFVEFKCNDNAISGNLTINEEIINNATIVDGKFTVYAIYQKKFVLNMGFEFENVLSGVELKTDWYELKAAHAIEYVKTIGNFEINGYLIYEGEAVTVLLKPNIRYAVKKVTGDNNKAQKFESNPEYFGIAMDQSYNLVVELKYNNIKVNYDVYVTDYNNDLDSADVEFTGTARYIATGEDENATMGYTEISAGDSDGQEFWAYEGTMLLYKYRAIEIKIYNFTDKKWELLEVVFENGIMVADDNFFSNYIGANGEARICLFAVQQYTVNFSTSGFKYDEDTNTFTNADLGSYTVEFSGYSKALGDGRYLVDAGVEVTLLKTVGKYGKFVEFTGLLSEAEKQTSSFIVTDSRNVGVNFQSTKLEPWVAAVIFGGGGLVIVLMFLTTFLIVRSNKLKKEKLAKDAEIADMKRRFNIADEISKLRSGNIDSLPQSKS